MGVFKITKVFHFEAAHDLPHYDGACHSLHGHSYSVEVTVKGKPIEDIENPMCGMVIDFKDLKSIVEGAVIKELDHSYLNDVFTNPTAENIVEGIFSSIKSNLPSSITLVSCKLWETHDSYVEYSEEE